MKNNTIVTSGYCMVSIVVFVFFACTSAFAGEADVLKVSVHKTAQQTYDFAVTVSHKDAGWEHYANKWDIVDEKGTVLDAYNICKGIIHEIF